MTRRESPPAALVSSGVVAPASAGSVKTRSYGRVARRILVGGAMLVVTGATASACLDRPVAPAEPRTSNTFSEKVSLTKIDKIDLLFMIDNSASMADKQTILATAVPDLVNRLVRPDCVQVDKDSGKVLARKESNGGVCETGFTVEFNAIKDIHIGIVTSSLGGHGSDQCDPTKPDARVGQDDRGKLLTRNLQNTAEATWNGTGFFQWDPDSNKSPPGSGFDGSGKAELIVPFGKVVQGAGQSGCGYEASLEAWYRFLVEPAPPNQVTKAASPGNTVAPAGLDDDLLQQRAEFLRPDSLLAIVNLSDENDCSTAEGVLPAEVKRFSGSAEEVPPGWEDLAGNRSFAANYLMAQGANAGAAFRMKSGSTACAQDPYSDACVSCFQDAAAPGCRTLPPEEDNPSLRCWDQKRRFGVDMLYPVQRYVDGLREATVFPLHDRAVREDGSPAGAGEPVPNPIFQDLPYLRYKALKARFEAGELDEATFNAKIANFGPEIKTRAPFPARGADTVFFAAIVGVPWQDIAVNDKDLKEGYLTADQVKWDNLLAGPGVVPGDPHMIEAVEPRSGKNPITGDTLGLTADDKINGHEWNSGKQDLMYACRFPLAKPKNCTDPGVGDCDCNFADPANKDPAVTQAAADAAANPLCQDPQTKKFGEVQHFAKAYPGGRFMQVMNRFQSGSIIASICTPNVDRPGEADFGYRPAVSAIIDRLKSQLTGKCTPRRLAANPDGSTPCLIVDAQFDSTLGDVDQGTLDECKACAGNGRDPLDKNPDLEALLRRNPDVARFRCLCKVTQFAGAQLDQCKNGDTIESVDGENQGWCYADNSALGAADQSPLTKGCPSHSTINLATETNKSTFFITCLGAAIGSGGGVDTTPAAPTGEEPLVKLV